MIISYGVWASLTVLILVGIAIVFKLTRFKHGTKILNTTFLTLLLIFIVAATTIFIMYPTPSPKTTSMVVNLHNVDPTLEYVVVTIESFKDSIRIDNGQTIYAVPINPLDTITATGHGYGSKTYTLTTTFEEITEPDLYFTIGGIFNNLSYIPLTITNNTSYDFQLYSMNMNGQIIEYVLAPVGVSNMYAFTGQKIYTSTSKTSTGVIIINNTIDTLTIDSNGTIAIDSNINSGNVKFKNDTGIDGILQSKNPWVINSAFMTIGILNANETTDKETAYVTQEWRLIDKNNNQISSIYSITQEDIDNENTIDLDINN